MATGRVADEQPEKGSDRKREEQPRQEIQELGVVSRSGCEAMPLK